MSALAELPTQPHDSSTIRPPDEATDSVAVRSACETDVPAIHRLICRYLEVGHLLPRSAQEIALHIPRFVVAVSCDRVIGCAELAPLSETVGEVRSLVVDEAFRGHGIGARLVEELTERAQRDGLDTLCAFTHEPARFIRLGFSIVPHVWLPEKIATDCVSCSAFRRCGQWAMVRSLGAGDAGRRHTGERSFSTSWAAAAAQINTTSGRWPLWLHV